MTLDVSDVAEAAAADGHVCVVADVEHAAVDPVDRRALRAGAAPPSRARRTAPTAAAAQVARSVDAHFVFDARLAREADREAIRRRGRRAARSCRTVGAADTTWPLSVRAALTAPARSRRRHELVERELVGLVVRDHTGLCGRGRRHEAARAGRTRSASRRCRRRRRHDQQPILEVVDRLQSPRRCPRTPRAARAARACRARSGRRSRTTRTAGCRACAGA